MRDIIQGSKLQSVYGFSRTTRYRIDPVTMHLIFATFKALGICVDIVVAVPISCNDLPLAWC